MGYKEWLSIAAGVLTVLGSLWYIWAVLRGAQPKWVTWFTWGMLDFIILVGMWRSGHVTNWQIIFCTVSAWTVFILALKYGVPGWDRVDKICLIGAVIGLTLLWHFPAWALALSLTATIIAATPTYVSAWHEPRRENASAWLIAVVASLLLLFAVPWTFAAIAQPLTFMFVNGTVPLIVLLRKRERQALA